MKGGKKVNAAKEKRREKRGNSIRKEKEWQQQGKGETLIPDRKGNDSCPLPGKEKKTSALTAK